MDVVENEEILSTVVRIEIKYIKWHVFSNSIHSSNKYLSRGVSYLLQN